MQNNSSENVTVFSPGVERNILSICLRDTEAINEVESSDVYADMFSVPGHQYLFMSLLYLYQKQQKPDAMAIMEVIANKESKAQVEKLGGIEYLTTLSQAYTSRDNLKIYIEKLRQAHTRKKLLDISNDVTKFINSPQAEVLNPSELVGYMENKINDLSVQANRVDEVYKMGESTASILEERAKTPSVVPGLEVGWVQYDRATRGARPGDLIFVCAPSKTGKSVILLNWARKMGVEDKLPILYIDTEMNEREQEDRLLAQLTGIPEDEIISGMYVQDTVNGTADEKCAKIKKAQQQLIDGNLYHLYMPEFSIEKVKAIAKKFQKQFGIVALFFDYIKIPSTEGNGKLQEHQALRFFASALKELAGTLNIPILSACQANRSRVNNDDPDASDIGGSYGILQLASKLMFLYNKSEEQIAKEGFDAGNQKLFIKYQRGGSSNTDPINIMFDRPTLKMTEV